MNPSDKEPRPVPRHSSMNSVASFLDVAPRVRLREVGSTHGPGEPAAVPVPTGPTFRAARTLFQIRAELADGSVSQVLRAHDDDLGRDVALKVLRADLSKDPEMVQRFIEEAQIGGQLQHPGIVPVYEMGVGEDERPYFTMKFIKGRTLSVLLGDRSDPRSDWRHWVPVFEHICQTMAYAHARGVIHRDLKPSNVMVGAFGEVLVVDWGLARVLRYGGIADEIRAKQPNVSVIETIRSKSGSSGWESGSILGTPAYMPPEQALGDLDRVDERSDVFSLGAILCEILTGQPPYDGEDERTVAQAAHAKLDDARARLEGCGADAELVKLAEACLAPAPSARPRNAEVLARRVHAYLAAIEEHSRQAQLEVAAARVKAEEERRSRKLSAALAGALLGVVLVGGGAYLWVGSQRTARAARFAQEVEDSLEAAVSARGAGDFEAALSAIGQARSLVESRGTEAALAARVDQTWTTIQREADATRQQRERDEKDLGLLATFDYIHSRDLPGEPTPERYENRNALYEECFAGYGIPVRELSFDQAVADIGDSNISREIALVLDDWAHVVRQLDGFYAEDAVHLDAIARELDPHPWRRAMREAIQENDFGTLQWLLESEDAPVMPPVTIGVLVQQTRDFELDLKLLRRAQTLNPENFLINVFLGGTHLLVTGDEEQGLPFLIAARAQRPESVSTHYYLGQLYRQLGLFRKARDAYRDAISRAPDHVEAWRNLARALYQRGELEESIRASKEVVRFRPDNFEVYNWMGLRYLELKDKVGAMEMFRESVRIGPDNVVGRGNLDLMEQGWNTEAERLQLLRGVLEEFPEAFRTRVSLIGALLSGEDPSVRDTDEAIRLLEAGLARSDNSIYWTFMGIAHIRKGEFEQAIEATERAMSSYPYRDASDLCVMAQAHHGLGRRDLALEYFEEADAWVTENTPYKDDYLRIVAETRAVLGVD